MKNPIITKGVMEISRPAGCCRRLMAKAFPSGYGEEFKGTFKIAWAIVLTQVCEIYFQPIAVMFGGHLGKLELDAIALSNTLINVLGFSIIIGMATSCETVFSQCYGFGDFKMVGIYLQRSLYIHILAMLPCYAIHLNIETILVAIGQDPEVAELTGKYLLYFMPGMMCLCLTTVLRRYTQCQSKVVPHIFIMGAAHILHAVLQYLFLYQLKMGILGSAVAQDITFFFILVVTCIYTHFSEVHSYSWGGWDWQGLMDWGPLARLALYGMLMVGFEWWAFELSIILSGFIGTTELAAQCVAFNLDAMYYGFIYGIGIATGIRVGQSLGANQPVLACTSARVGMTITGTMGLISGILYASLRYELPKLFTNDKDVIAIVANILPVLGLYAIASGINVIGRGVFRGIGWQKTGSILSFVAFFIFAWPIAIPLTFYTPLSVVGLWMGFMIALFLSGGFYIIVVLFRINWQYLSEEAVLQAKQNRLRTSSHHSSMHEEQHYEETTPLIHPHRFSRTYSFSGHGPGIDDKIADRIVAEIERSNKFPHFTPGVVMKRILTVVAFVIILLVGISFRIGFEYTADRNLSSPVTNVSTTESILVVTTGHVVG